MKTPNLYAPAGFPASARSTNGLPSIPVDPELHRRLVIAAAAHTPLVPDVGHRLELLVEPTLLALVERMEAGVEHHRPSRFCRCGGPGCSAAYVAPVVVSEIAAGTAPELAPVIEEHPARCMCAGTGCALRPTR